ncbi:hypothetical protein PMAYCL1PPCAC_10931, partial [Pristionchus mayeri]
FLLSMANLLVNEQHSIQSIVQFPSAKEFSFCGWVKPWANGSENKNIITMLGDRTTITMTTQGLEIRSAQITAFVVLFEFKDYQWNQFCVLCKELVCDMYSNGSLTSFVDKEDEAQGDTYYAAVLAPTEAEYNERINGYLNQIEVTSYEAWFILEF